MQLQVFISGNDDKVQSILKAFMESNISGSTVVDCQGGLQVLGHSDETDLSFGLLRHFLNPEGESGKLIMTVLTDEQAPAARKIVLDTVGDINRPGEGILFNVPILSAEGLSKR